MQLSVKKGDILKEVCDVVVLGVFAKENESGKTFALVDEQLSGRLALHMKEDRFKAELGSTFVSRTFESLPAKRVLVVGLGKKNEFDLESIRIAAGAAFNLAKSFRIKTAAMDLLGLDQELGVEECTQAMVEGIRLADYSFAVYKKAEGKSPESVVLVVGDGRLARTAEKGLALGEMYAEGTAFARDLVNTPGQDMHPDRLVQIAREVAKAKSSIRVRVFGKDQLERMGAGGILGVAQGSDQPAYLVHMIYKPKKSTKKRICLVGKAVTFDSGGLSLKPADFMTTMKMDMAGAADVLGVFSVIHRLAPMVEVHGIFAPVENMPSGKAIRPGDVLRMMNKKTVEVLNTDAEGRLTLADSLFYAEKQKPSVMIDLATLTGACMIALGEEITGIMSNNKELAERLLSCARATGEKMWELPLEKNYAPLLKSDVADLKNLGGKWGGALTAGLFLQEFVKSTPWAHLDIAGPAYSERPINAYNKKGASGHGVRTLLEYLRTY